LGREVHPILRAAVLPGAELVLPWLSAAATRSISTMVKTFGRMGFRRESADLEQTWRSFFGLGDPQARRAFLHTVRGLVDLGGQRVSATDKLYLAAGLPTLIVWGEKDPLIPVDHAYRARDTMQGSRLEIFPGAGHYPYLDAPERFVTVLRDFLESTEPQPVDASRLRTRLRAGPHPPSPTNARARAERHH
jgi:pimeloyl-ACP methyl ester carboxylesterase